ncbi:MAG: hypothetical protein JW776_09975 [Candidatus Lokiarchaeota archaeon]|nr:hypothetical protein [Candidatus Lokiarchaeota archaeon]
MVKVKDIVPILQTSLEYQEFTKKNPKFDTVIRILSMEDIKYTQKCYPELNLFSNFNGKKLIGVTIVSRHIQQNGYPKIKAYIDMKNKKIFHLFSSG